MRISFGSHPVDQWECSPFVAINLSAFHDLYTINAIAFRTCNSTRWMVRKAIANCNYRTKIIGHGLGHHFWKLKQLIPISNTFHDIIIYRWKCRSIATRLNEALWTKGFWRNNKSSSTNQNNSWRNQPHHPLCLTSFSIFSKLS